MDLASAIVRQVPILILISFDGFRNDYISRDITPNLYELLPYSTRGYMESLYITKTFPNHFSMATGLYEDEHKIINNKMYDPHLNQTFKPGNEQPEWWNPNGKTMPIWTANQIVNNNNSNEPRHSGVIMYPGAHVPYFDTLPSHFKSFDTVRNWTLNVDTVIDWLTDSERPANFVCMYFDDPDHEAHLHGPWGDETLASIRRVDSAAGYLIKRLRELNLADATNILFVSDHGMAEVKSVVYLSDIVDTSKLDVYGTSPDWNVFVKHKYRSQRSKIFLELLSASKKNHFKVYKRQDLPSHFHYSKTDRVGDFFILVDPHYDMFLDRKKQFEPFPKVWGNHGWRPTEPDMRPLFLAMGPSFKQDYYHSTPFPNIDIFPLMTFLLDLSAKELPNNGSLARVIDMIDVNHFELFKTDGPIKLAYILVIGASFLTLLGIVFTFFARSKTKQTKFSGKQSVDFDDLAPGLNIDLNYYITGMPDIQIDKKNRKKEELLSLLHY